MNDALWIGVYPGLTDEMLRVHGRADAPRLRGEVSAVPDAPKVQEPAETPGRLAAFMEDLSYWPAVGGIVRVCRSRREQILYLIVGGWNTLFGYLIWALLQYLLHDYLYYLVILVLAWFPAVLNAYFGYRIFVFRSRGRIWHELPRFSLVYVGTLCVSLIVPADPAARAAVQHLRDAGPLFTVVDGGVQLPGAQVLQLRRWALPLGAAFSEATERQEECHPQKGPA